MAKSFWQALLYEVKAEECFYAWKGGNAFMNNKQIHVSKAPTVADSLIATGVSVL